MQGTPPPPSTSAAPSSQPAAAPLAMAPPPAVGMSSLLPDAAVDAVPPPPSPPPSPPPPLKPARALSEKGGFRGRPAKAGASGALQFHAGSLKFCDAELEANYWSAQHERLAAAERRLARPHVLVHAGLLLKVLQSQASLAAVTVCAVSLMSVVAAAWLTSARPQLWARIRDPFLSLGHVLYMIEGSAMLRSFAVVVCQPRLVMWAAAVMTSATPWLLLDPLLLPVPYSMLRWVQPLSAAALLPTNALRCRLNMSQCGAEACAQFEEAGGALGLLARLASPAAPLLAGGAGECSCPALMAWLQGVLGVGLVLRIAKARERRQRVRYALAMGCDSLADELQSVEKPLAVQACELLFLGAVLAVVVQQVPALLP